MKLLNGLNDSLKILLILLIICSCQERKRKIYSDGKEGRKELLKDQIFIRSLTLKSSKKGFWIGYNDTGQVKTYYDYVGDSKNNGQVIYFWESGNIFATGSVKQGLNEGNWTYFYENGNIASKGTYRNSEKVGNWLFYTKNNQLNQIIEYSKNGQDKILLDNKLVKH